ncbi:MAG: endonuclease/exonuclease/phosphatase family protein [Chloroflexi bacterium]|nr:endonuclease/exonuclease/phosphatase family protein [Chloroflexota bacterium]MBK6711820.1 endonuclease/exonuclease/phosphatase family protein [Chloroflexota bacterium]MBK8931642.1 endonuclease/exonuclease/phosphatase family protein [Chloroflexota bacterium]
MTTITVATINLRNNSDRWRDRRQVLVNQLVDTTPDLVSLQEVHFPIRQGAWLRNQVNMRLTGSVRRPYRLIQRRKHHLVRGYYEGVGILTRLPVRYHDSVALGYGGRVALRVNVELDNRQTLDFVTTHLHHIPYDKEARLEQVMRLLGWLRDRRHIANQIVAGDFNEIPTGLAVERMKQAFRSAYAIAHHHEPLATFPTALIPPSPAGYVEEGALGACLDYIFVASSVRVTAVAIFCNKPAPDDDTLYPSDHVGLLATVEI